MGNYMFPAALVKQNKWQRTNTFEIDTSIFVHEQRVAKFATYVVLTPNKT